jgi:hypothetical protein
MSAITELNGHMEVCQKRFVFEMRHCCNPFEIDQLIGLSQTIHQPLPEYYSERLRI